MKRFAAVCTIILTVVALFAAEGSAWVRCAFYNAPATAYTASQKIETRVGKISFEKYDSVTITLTEKQLSRFYKSVRPKTLSSYQVEGITVTDGYSVHLSNLFFAGESPCNFQIAERGDKILLGLPVLAGGY